MKELVLYNFISDILKTSGDAGIDSVNGLRSDREPDLFEKKSSGIPITSDTKSGSHDNVGKLAGLHAVHYFKNMGNKNDFVINGYLGCLMTRESGGKEIKRLLSENMMMESKEK